MYCIFMFIKEFSILIYSSIFELLWQHMEQGG